MTVALGTNIANPISTALSQWLGFDTMGKLANYGKIGVTDPDAVIKALFANSEQGVWLDPSDLTTMFQDRAGTTPVTADGQTVGKILDKSGRGNHATAPNDAARPLYKTDGTYHWLQHDGVVDSLLAGISTPIADALSSFVGMKLNAFSIGLNLFELSATSRADSSLGVQSGATSTIQCYVYGAGYSSEVSYSKTTNAGLKQVFTCYSPSPSVIRFNGAVAATNAGTAWPDTPISKIGIGADTNGNNSSTVNIYSLIVLGRLATTQEITDTETWVNSKCGAY